MNDCCYRKGAIIYISSMAGYLPGFNIYGLAKAALINLTKTVALTLGPQNVRVNAIAPGIIETNMTTPVRQLFSYQNIDN